MTFLLATGFFENFANDPFSYLWKGVGIIFVLVFLVKFVIAAIKGEVL